MPSDTLAPEGNQAEQGGGFSNAEKMKALLSQAEVAVETGSNDEWNHKMRAKRETDAAQERLDVHDSAAKKITLAQELLAHPDGTGVSEEAAEYLKTGSFDQLMAEIDLYMIEGAKTSREQVKSVDQELADSRKSLAEESLKHKGVLHRQERVDAKQMAEERYLKAFAAKIEQLSSIPMGDREEALRAGYLPEVVEKMTFDSKEYGIEELAANQLHLLTDMLCREQLRIQEAAEEVSNKGAKKLLNMVRGSKLAQGAVAAGVVTATAVTLASGTSAAMVAAQGLGVLGAVLTSRNILEGGIESGRKFLLGHRRKGGMEQLATDPQSADLTLRTAYNEIEYIPKDRHGTDDKAENLRRFDGIALDYKGLEDAPGGKPYSAEMMLDYCRQLYLEHRDQVDKLAAAADPESRRLAYNELAQLMLSNDVEQMQREISRGRVQKTILRGVSIFAGAVATNFLSSIDNATSVSSQALSRRASHNI